MDDRTLIQRTAVDERTLKCPLCDFTVDVPPVPVSDALGAIFGLSGDTLARVHGDQSLKRATGELRRHLASHPAEVWLEHLCTARMMLADQVRMWTEVQALYRG